MSKEHHKPPLDSQTVLLWRYGASLGPNIVKEPQQATIDAIMQINEILQEFEIDQLEIDAALRRSLYDIDSADTNPHYLFILKALPLQLLTINMPGVDNPKTSEAYLRKALLLALGGELHGCCDTDSTELYENFTCKSVDKAVCREKYVRNVVRDLMYTLSSANYVYSQEHGVHSMDLGKKLNLLVNFASEKKLWSRRAANEASIVVMREANEFFESLDKLLVIGE